MKEEKEIRGIGGWLLLSVIGMIVTVIVMIFLILDLVTNYYVSSVIDFLIYYLFILCFLIANLIFIFNKKKSARKLNIIIFICFAVMYVFKGIYMGAIASFVWAGYFYKSKRVKNTFVR